MIYVLMGIGAAILVPVASIGLLLWGLGGIVNTLQDAEIEDEET